jgi:HEAT repeat protein
MTSELNVLNAGSRRARPQEVLAAYIIQSLTILKAKAAFRDVAVASVAWYTPKSGVCELAKNALSALSTDPFAATLVLLGSDDDLIFRENFFNSLGLDKDPVAGGAAADAVLSTLVTFQLRDSREKDSAVRLLKAALIAADKSPKPPATLAGPLKVLITKKNDLVLKLIAVRVLAKIGDDASINVLISSLEDLNQRQKMGSISSQDVTLVRELIVSLGVTKKSMAQSVLQEVRFCNYTPAIVNLALESIAKLNS